MNQDSTRTPPPPRARVRPPGLVALAGVCIVLAIAWAAYSSWAPRAHRADARTALLLNAQFMERNFTLRGSYALDAAGARIDRRYVLPNRQSPPSGTPLYEIRVLHATASAYSLSADPVAGGRMAGDACGSLVLADRGRRQVRHARLDAAACWAD